MSTVRFLVLGSALALALAGCHAGPPTAAASASAAPAAVPPDFATTGDAVPAGDHVALADLGVPGTSLHDLTLIGPHFGEVFGEWATVDELTQSQQAKMALAQQPGGGTATMRAGKDHTFLLLTGADHDDGLPTGQAASNQKPVTVTLTAAGTSRPLVDSLPTRYEILVAVIPKGGDIVLAVTDSGRTQSVNLTTGRRGADAIPLYYPIRSGTAELRDLVVIPSVTPAGRGDTMNLTVELTLLPYLDSRGWAPAGRAWLAIDVGLICSARVALALNLRASLSLRPAGGAALTLPGNAGLTTSASAVAGLPGGSWDGAVAVAPSLRTIAVTFTTHATITHAGTRLSFRRYAYHNSGTVRLTPAP